MKNTITFILALLLACTLQAQKDHKIAHNGGSLIIKGIDEVSVEGYNGSEIIISANIKGNTEDSERAKGLKMINAMGLEDNTGLGLSAIKDGGNVTLKQIGQCNCQGGYRIKLPKSMGLEYSHTNNTGDDLTVKGVDKEIVISTTFGDVMLQDVSGPMSVQTVHGDIDVIVSQLSSTNANTLHSAHGHIDVALPASTKANLLLNTAWGEIFTDMDIDIEKSSERSYDYGSKQIVKGKLNGGGVSLTVSSSHDNIYLRKK